MTIVFVDHRPFSHFLKNGFRQRVGRILHHLIHEQRIERIIYLWWNQEPFSSGSYVQNLPGGFEKVTLFESRRSHIPFARSLHLDAWTDRHRVASAASTISTFNVGPCWIWATDPEFAYLCGALADRIGGRLAYDLIDNFAVYEGIDEKQRSLYREGYRQVSASADRIFYQQPAKCGFAVSPGQ